jgi:hypothetical protein
VSQSVIISLKTIGDESLFNLIQERVILMIKKLRAKTILEIAKRVHLARKALA